MSDQSTSTEPKIINLTEDAEQFVGKYFRTVWRHRSEPYQYCALYVKEPGPSKNKYTVVVLYDRRELEIPVNYPLVEISEKEAQMLADAKNQHRKHMQTEPEATETTEAGTTTATEGGTTPGATPAPPETGAPAGKKKEKGPKKEPKKRDGTSRSATIKAGIAEGLSKDQILDKLMLLDPSGDKKKITAHIAVLIYADRKKTNVSAKTTA